MMGLFGENPTWGYFSHNLHHALQSCMKFLSHTLVSIGVFKKSNIFCMKPEVVWELSVFQLRAWCARLRLNVCVGVSEGLLTAVRFRAPLQPFRPAGPPEEPPRRPPPRSPAPPGASETPPGHKGQCIYPATRWIPPLIQLFVPFFPG